MVIARDKAARPERIGEFLVAANVIRSNVLVEALSIKNRLVRLDVFL